MSSNSKTEVPPKMRKVRCPQCGRSTFYSMENPFRPFCSERCRTIDLGQWADESFRIPIDEATPPTDDGSPFDDSDKYE